VNAILGIEIGGTKLQIVAGDASGKIRVRQRFAVDRAAGGAGIRRQIEQTLPGLQRAHAVTAIGAGFGGPFDWKTGRVDRSHQIEGWPPEFDLVGWLHRLAGVPVFADNDTNVGALGEAVCGGGAGASPFFYTNLGSGVGGGLIVTGRIYHGATPGEAEIGHIRLDRHGTTVESRCAGWAVDARIRELKAQAPDSVLARLAAQSPGSEARHLGPALAQADPIARQILAETAEDFAFALSHVVHLFHPETICIGGGLSLLGEPLRAAVERALRPMIMEAFQPGPTVRLAALGEDAVPAGALLLAGGGRVPAPAK